MSRKERIDIYVSTWGEICYGCKRKWHPIEVGGVNRQNGGKPFIYSLRDDSGDNISKENPYYGELTALYWIWKNTDSSMVGFYHYNKKLNISERKAVRLLNNGYQFIVAKRDYMPDHARREEYKVFIKVLKKYEPEIAKTYESFISEEGHGYLSGKNMFITTRERMNEYCGFLFPLLDCVRMEIGDTDTSPYYKRYCAFFAERLLTVWIVHNNLVTYEVNVAMQGPWYYKVGLKIHGLLRHILPPKIMLRFNWLLRRSSYKKEDSTE